MYQVPLPTCLLAGGLCSVSGMLPDIDSDSGTPLRESVAFGAAVAPMLLLGRFQQVGMSHESIVLAAAGIYLLIRFGLSWALKRYTVHRGMFHSIPAALVFGEIAFLGASGDDAMRLYKAGAIVMGYLSHLLLDEIYSIEWSRGRLRLKSSFGTALKLFGRSSWSNLTTYAKLLLLTAVILVEPRSPQNVARPDASPTIQQKVTQLIDQVWRR